MALSTSITVVTRSGLSTHDHYDVRNLFSVGVATFSNFKTGSSNLHSAGVEVAGVNVLGGDTPIGSGSTIYDDGGARFSGVITATSFHGDISNATGAIGLDFVGPVVSVDAVSNTGIATVRVEGLSIKDEGSTVGTAGSITTINFVGAGIAAAVSGDTATVTSAGGVTNADVVALAIALG